MNKKDIIFIKEIKTLIKDLKNYGTGSNAGYQDFHLDKEYDIYFTVRLIKKRLYEHKKTAKASQKLAFSRMKKQKLRQEEHKVEEKDDSRAGE